MSSYNDSLILVALEVENEREGQEGKRRGTRQLLLASVGTHFSDGKTVYWKVPDPVSRCPLGKHGMIWPYEFRELERPSAAPSELGAQQLRAQSFGSLRMSVAQHWLLSHTPRAPRLPQSPCFLCSSLPSSLLFRLGS